MKVDIQIDKNDLLAVRMALKEKMDLLKDMKTPLSQISTVLYQSVMKNFQEQGTDKGRWKELSPITLMHRRKGKGSRTAKILQDTGYMKASITPEVNVEHDEASVGMTGSIAMIGKVHQYGTNHAGKNRNVTIPARPFMVLRKDYREKVINIVRRWVYGG